MANNPDNKDAWLKLLKQTSIPSFNASIQALSNAEEYLSSHSSELARSILKDPNLTASVLKLANSAQFNTYGQTVRTISRSIMLLGHKSIKEVCASCLLMDQFLKGGASNHVQSLLARSFHAAIQAKEIALLQGQKNTEEIFISALLLSLGEMSIYSAIEPGNPLAQQLREAYPLSGGKEKELLGCYFNDLTLGLCQSWNIAPMIGVMLGGKYAENSPVRSILLGNSFASSCELQGVNHAIETHLKSMTRYTGQAADKVTEKIVQATENTQKCLTQFGLKLDIKKANVTPKISQSDAVKIHIDKILQLDVIQELSVVVQDKVDINEVLQQLLEGIIRGAGFQSALVALLTPDRSRIIAKHALEREGNHTKDNFNFSCYYDIPEILQKVMNNQKVILQTSLRERGATLQQILKRTGNKNAIWGPLVVENKVIGCIYADNGANKAALITPEQKEAFQLFVYQSRFFLQHLS